MMKSVCVCVCVKEKILVMNIACHLYNTNCDLGNDSTRLPSYTFDNHYKQVGNKDKIKEYQLRSLLPRTVIKYQESIVQQSQLTYQSCG